MELKAFIYKALKAPDRVRHVWYVLRAGSPANAEIKRYLERDQRSGVAKFGAIFRWQKKCSFKLLSYATNRAVFWEERQWIKAVMMFNCLKIR